MEIRSRTRGNSIRTRLLLWTRCYIRLDWSEFDGRWTFFLFFFLSFPLPLLFLSSFARIIMIVTEATLRTRRGNDGKLERNFRGCRALAFGYFFNEQLPGKKYHISVKAAVRTVPYSFAPLGVLSRYLDSANRSIVLVSSLSSKGALRVKWGKLVEKFTSSIATVCLGTTWEQRNEKFYGKWANVLMSFIWMESKNYSELKFLQFLKIQVLINIK